ncbi:unnamed protein product [Polarella glacialis]|uniref:Uncharacterized protein n=1 Tax=Polarella glacialis TaxID=89957 RepID=A0A813EBZ6_POLGL|nr:unnamed protein product [Polarella glacialis]
MGAAATVAASKCMSATKPSVGLEQIVTDLADAAHALVSIEEGVSGERKKPLEKGAGGSLEHLLGLASRLVSRANPRFVEVALSSPSKDPVRLGLVFGALRLLAETRHPGQAMAIDPLETALLRAKTHGSRHHADKTLGFVSHAVTSVRYVSSTVTASLCRRRSSLAALEKWGGRCSAPRVSAVLSARECLLEAVLRVLEDAWRTLPMNFLPLPSDELCMLAHLWARNRGLELRAHLLGSAAAQEHQGGGGPSIWLSAKESAYFAEQRKPLLTPRPAELRGIRLRQLRELLGLQHSWLQIPKYATEFGGRVRPSTHQLHTEVLVPIASCDGHSFAELYPPQPAQVFVSHFWGQEFEDLVLALERHALEMTGGSEDWPESCYWLGVFAETSAQTSCGKGRQMNAEQSGDPVNNNSNNKKKKNNDNNTNNNNHTNKSIKNPLAASMAVLASASCRSIAIVFDEAGRLPTRLWCLFELMLANESSLPVDACTTQCVLGRGHASAGRARSIAQRLLAVDPSMAVTSLPEDMQTLRQLLQQRASGIEALRHALLALAGPLFCLGEVLEPVVDLFTQQSLHPLSGSLFFPSVLEQQGTHGAKAGGSPGRTVEEGAVLSREQLAQRLLCEEGGSSCCFNGLLLEAAPGCGRGVLARSLLLGLSRPAPFSFSTRPPATSVLCAGAPPVGSVVRVMSGSPLLPIRVKAASLAKLMRQKQLSADDNVLSAWLRHEKDTDADDGVSCTITMGLLKELIDTPEKFGYGGVVLLLEGMEDSDAEASVLAAWLQGWLAQGPRRHRVLVTSRPPPMEGSEWHCSPAVAAAAAAARQRLAPVTATKGGAAEPRASDDSCSSSRFLIAEVQPLDRQDQETFCRVRRRSKAWTAKELEARGVV